MFSKNAGCLAVMPTLWPQYFESQTQNKQAYQGKFAPAYLYSELVTWWPCRHRITFFPPKRATCKRSIYLPVDGPCKEKPLQAFDWFWIKCLFASCWLLWFLLLQRDGPLSVFLLSLSMFLLTRTFCSDVRCLQWYGCKEATAFLYMGHQEGK